MSWYVSRGRINRSTFWLKYFLPVFVVMVVVSAVVFTAFGQSSEPGQVSVTGGPALLLFVVYLALAVPSVSSAVTRLHDTGRSAWWLLIGLVPLVGGIVLLVFYCLEGEPQPNQGGPPTTARFVPAGAPLAAGQQ